MKTKNQIEHKREWWCNTCSQKEPLTSTQMKDHLKIVHGIEGKLEAKRSLVLALDGDSYSNTFEWEIKGVKFTEVSSGPK